MREMNHDLEGNPLDKNTKAAIISFQEVKDAADQLAEILGKEELGPTLPLAMGLIFLGYSVMRGCGVHPDVVKQVSEALLEGFAHLPSARSSGGVVDNDLARLMLTPTGKAN